MPHDLPIKGSDPHARTLVLASGSPRRRRLINAIDMPVQMVGSGDYEPPPNVGESPQAYVQRLALLKARQALKGVTDAIVLGADTSVVIDGDILGKPADAAEAVWMLKLLRGRSHEVVTGTALMDAATGICSTSAKASRIFMRDYADEEIAAYVESGEPFDKAGAYAVQDDKFRPAERIEGCYLNTVGLPLCDLLTLLKRIGAPVTFRKGYVIPPGCPDCDYWKVITEGLQEVNRL